MHEPTSSLPMDDDACDRRAASDYVAAAFAEAELDGLDGDFVAHAALFEALRYLVDLYGEEPTATFLEGFPAKLRAGSYTTALRH